MSKTRSLIGIESNFIHCSCSVVGRVVVVGDADVDGRFENVNVGVSVSVGLKLGCWDGASVVGDDVGIFVDCFIVGTELERIVGLFVVG